MQVRISDFTELSLLAWNRRKEDVLSGPEALALYERNWHLIDHDALDPKERALIDQLAQEYGGGVLNV